jgi:hypothetical protein
MKLAVEISDASDLPPKDNAATCNAFVEVDFDGQKQRTATRPADRSPQWNETLLFDVRDDPDPGRLPSIPAVEVSVLHDRRLTAGRHCQSSKGDGQEDGRHHGELLHA